MKRINLLLAAIFCGAAASHAATFTFTTCGATGAAGPDQSMCDGAYGAGVVAVSAGIQSWTVPATGTYRITATGARGMSADVTALGGRGARISGDFNLTAGQVLKLAVGQQGLGAVDGDSGGGGGGSFIVSAADAPMLIAGGGGGTRHDVDQNGCDASVTQRAEVGSGNETTSSCGLKAGSEGDGGIISDESYGSAGAGFLSDGTTDPEGGGSHGGGYSWPNGMLGGVSDDDGAGSVADGGFGGGGDGRGSDGGGGGGGYSGGDGGRLAGGGGSFNAGANPNGFIGVGTGAGRIVITDDLTPVVAATAVPALSGRMLIVLASLLAFGALVTLRRRRTIR